MSLLDTIKSHRVIPESKSNKIVINLRVVKTLIFLDYLDSKPPLESDPENIFGSKESTVGLYLAQGLLGLCSDISIYQTNLVFYLEAKNPDIIHLTNLFSSESVLRLSNLYPSPKVLIDIYNPPDFLIYQRHWQMCWFAHLRRCLGELYKPHISRYNREYPVKELQQEFEADPLFNWELIPNSVKYGYQYEKKSLITRNFCRGTAGDLY